MWVWIFAFGWSRLPFSSLAFCQHPGQGWSGTEGGGWTGYRTEDVQRLWLSVLLILKAELFQQQTRNILHDLSACGKTLKKNQSLRSRFSQTEKRQRLQNKLLLIVIFLDIEIVISGRNGLIVNSDGARHLITACVRYPEKWHINALSPFLSHKWNYDVLFLRFWGLEGAI